MKKFPLNFTVGPSKLYHGVEENLCKLITSGHAELSHRSKEFTDISKSGITDLKKFFNIPNEYKIFYTYSSTEGLEISIRALVEKKSVHYINGTFGWVWANTAKKNGKEVEIHEEILGTRAELQSLEKTKTDMVCITANETSTGIKYSSEEIKNFRTKLDEKILLAIDCTSVMGGIAYDFSSADVWSFSVQKALGLPAGLGILILSPRAYQKALKREKNGNEAGNHHQISALEKKMDEKFQTPTTPNTLGIFSFADLCQKFLSDFKTITNLEKLTIEKAEFLYNFFENHSDFRPFISDKKYRSQTIIVIEGTFEKIRDKYQELQEKNIIVGTGYGLQKTTQLRIANFPVHSMEDMKTLVSFF